MPDSKGEEVTWTYTNLTPDPLVIERIDISCGCLSTITQPAQSPKDLLAPGQSSTIRATFTPGPYRGHIRKSLHVHFVGYSQAVELIADATIPSVVKLSRRDLVWHGAAHTHQSLDITAGTPTNIRISKLDGIDYTHYQIKKEIIKQGRHYRITIIPTSIPPSGVSILKIHTTSPDPRDKVLAVFLHRKPLTTEN